MKTSTCKLLIVLVILLALVSTGCSSSKGTATEAPKPAATEAPKVETASPAPATQAARGSVTSLDDVKSATIQIQAEGTFIDPQVGLVVNGAGRGSGFIIDPSGIAVTNNHVVTGSAIIKVWVGGNKEKIYNATVLGASECSDLAVIKIEGSDFPYLSWYDGTPKVGLEVYAAGYPLGDPEFTLTKGIVSKGSANGKTNWASVGAVLEHDARISPGNSGGPLVDKNGSVVGINYATNQENQYFAINRAEADAVLNQLKSGTDVTSIGVNGQAVVSDDGKLSGVWVSSVKSGSPADKSGMKAGDIITQLEGLVLATDGTMADYCQILRSHKPSDTLSMVVLRWANKEILEGQLNGREMKVTSTYGNGSQASSSGTQTSTGSQTSGGNTAITDDAKVISMEVPSDWEYNGGAWSDTWSIGSGTYPFTAQTLTAAPDVKAYTDGWDTTGIFVATSRDWGSIGGYANLMEGVRDFYKACKSGGTQNYSDDNYKGMMQAYTKCGGGKGNAVILSLRPKVNPTSYLVLVEMKFTTEDDLNKLEAILNTTNINP